jgi:hypothetical protein
MTMAPPPDLLTQRPSMPTPEDEERSVHQRARLSLLDENWDDLASDWNEKRVGEERSALQGLPDTSSNVLADMARQLSTPGLYGARPKLGHVEAIAQALVGPGGYFDRARYWVVMQHIQYITTGLSDMFVGLDVVGRELTVEPVYPHDIQIIWHPSKPGVMVGLWRLRIRKLPDPINAWVWAWDQYDLGEREEIDGEMTEIRPPSFRVVGASGDWKDQPITNLVVKGAPADGLVGDAYRWRFEDSTPFVPFIRYADVDRGGGWNWTHRRGAMRGAMKAQEFWTYASSAAQDASGRCVIIAGLEPMGAEVQDAGTKDKVRTIRLKPGSLMYHRVSDPGTQPFLEEVGPGANVKELLDYAERFEGRQLRRWGIDTAGAEKGASDPTSGAAKFVSRQQKREVAARTRPLYEASDLEAVRIGAALLRIAGVGTFPEKGYSIEHAAIAMSDDELAALRDDIDWQEAKGSISKVEAYKLRHPGSSDADAMAALVRAKVENARLEQAVQEALVDEGLAEKVTPDPATTPGAGGGAAVADTALNGAQAQALSAIVEKVSAGILAPDVAKLILPITFPTISQAEADRMVDAAARFTPAQSAPTAPPTAA